MSEKTLEEQQAEYDAWVKSQGASPPGKKVLKITHTGPAPETVSQRAGKIVRRSVFKESFYVEYFRITGILSFLGAICVLFLDLSLMAKISTVIGCLVSALIWFAIAKAMAMLEELHWKSKE